MNSWARKTAIGSLLVLCLLLGDTISRSNAQSGNALTAEGARLVRSFVEGEFLGEPSKRLEMGAMKVSGKVLYGDALNENSYPGLIVSYTADPIIIVSKYSMGEVAELRDGFLVSVSFDVVAITSGSGIPGRRIAEKSKYSETVPYNVISINGAWRILNPPKPRVSIRSLRDLYAEELKQLAAVVDASSNPSGSQKAAYSHLTSEKDLLDGIAN